MFSVNPHLLKCRVVKNVCGAFVVHQDPVRVIVPYPDANDKCIIMWVVKTSASSSKKPITGLSIRVIFGTALVS